ncbi:hypothetical protein HPP92_006380 [Vanilla planifolia]|uniref:Dynamin-type G domain-containing protein n=1 Tax=Vanilla planifolia TaxID=51239 RepID=A0A835VBU3_VANPL|nr:hypothetical protein HPP92_006380 [Vanilla planifolia]
MAANTLTAKTPVKTPNPKAHSAAARRAPPQPAAQNESSACSAADFKLRFEAYNRLQAAAFAFGEKLPIPEIVAVGGQSDGKSSLLEALLGFRFNVREVEMGTRRPLVLQMVHDPSALEPRCRFQDEDSEAYGSPVVAATTVADLIRSRTEAHLKKIHAAVSSKPIIMRAEYAHCPNLTIIDTPGFVLKAKKGEPENTPDEILSMVKSLASPPHRLLMFLQQSSVEWCSSLWLDSIREIDPTFKRTIVVVSKFDNRLKEFGERWEVDRYFSASGYLGENTHPFFVALPKDRGLVSNEEFRRQISQVDVEILRHLRESVKGGFNEEKFGPYVGFGCLREFLEAELQKRYKEAAPATLALLEQRCSEVSAELGRVESKLQATSDVAHLRRSAMLHAASICSHVVANILLAHAGRGAGGGMVEAAAEIARAAARAWLAPILDTACDRLAFVLRSLFDLAMERGRSHDSDYQQKSGDMVGFIGFHAALRRSYNSFVNGLSKHCKQLVRHHLDSVTSQYSQVCYEPDCGAGIDSGSNAFYRYNQLQSISYFLDLSDSGRDQEAAEQENKPPKEQQETTPGKRAESRDALKESQLTVPETPSPDQPSDTVLGVRKKENGYGVEMGGRKRQARVVTGGGRGYDGVRSLGDLRKSGSSYADICSLAAQHFSRIREVLIERSVPSALNSGFLTPCRERLVVALGLDLFAVDDDKFMDMFVAPGAVDVLQSERQSLQKREKILQSCLNEFKNIARSL